MDSCPLSGYTIPAYEIHSQNVFTPAHHDPFLCQVNALDNLKPFIVEYNWLFFQFNHWALTVCSNIQKF